MLPATTSALCRSASMAGPAAPVVSRPALYAATKSFTLSMASLLLVANDSHARTIARVVSDCCRCDSGILDVAADSETDADTDARYAGAIAVSTVGVPSVTVVHPTIDIRIAAVQPI